MFVLYFRPNSGLKAPMVTKYSSTLAFSTPLGVGGSQGITCGSYITLKDLSHSEKRSKHSSSQDFSFSAL
jgi:hypothetical protein